MKRRHQPRTIHVGGSINIDLIASVDRLPLPGETVPATGFSTAPGGKGANQALAARRAGAEVAISGAVGNDPFAEPALALLREAGVDLSRVRTTDAPTGTAMILVDKGGENQITIVAGANGRVGPGDLPAFRPGGIVLLALEIPVEAVAAALAAARAAGATSVLNAAPALREAAAVVGQADYLIVNESEFALFSGEAAAGVREGLPQRMRSFAERTGRTVIVTLGAQGAAAFADTFIEEKGLPIEPIDTVGAGDTFCGYFAAALAAGADLAGAIRLANRAAALACLKPGAQPAIPTLAEVEAFPTP